MLRVGLITAVVGFFIVAPLSAASRQIPLADFVLEVWEARDGGLPHPTVSTLLQTRDGYLWIGTATGLARFDGQQFYLPQRHGAPELNAHIRSLVESEDGTLWVGTRRQGLFRMKDGRTELMNSALGLTQVDARALVVHEGTLWVSSGSVIVGWDLKRQQARRLGPAEGLPSALVLALHVDAHGSLWAVLAGGLLARFDGSRFTVIPLVKGMEVRDMQSAGLSSDESGAVWAASESGLLRVTLPAEGAARVEVVVAEPCRSVFVGTSGVWAGTWEGLVHVRDGKVTRYGPREGLDQDWLDRIYEDADGSVWVASRTGLLRLRPRVVQTYTQREGGARFGATDCVLETRDGDLWVGSGAGLSRLHDGRWTTYDTRHGLPNSGVRALAEAPDGALWVATTAGITRFKDGRAAGVYTVPGTRPIVRALTLDAEGRPWFGTTGATVHRIENGRVVEVLPKRKECARGLPCHLRFARDGTLLLGNEEGLVRIRDGKMLSCDLDPEPLRTDIRHVHEDDRGRLWLGSVGGVSLWENGRLRAVPGDAGPFDTAAYAILDDERGAFWFSTPKGLFRVLKTNLEQGLAQGTTPIFRFFGTEDGMETGVCIGTGQPNGWRGRDGKLYFTTANGIAVVDPSRIQVSPNVPPVYITGLSADQNPVALGAAPRLAPGTRSLQIDFTAVNFVAPEMIQYRYRLEGFDRDWVVSGSRRTAYYTNLPPAPYRFRVSAANPDGVWNERGATLDFELAPYFYQRQGFIAFCAVMLVAGATLAYRLRIAHLRANERELKRRVEDAVAQVKTLRGLLPICASCKKIRDDTGYWNQMETYISDHSGADFSHSVCPDCMMKLYPEYARLQQTPAADAPPKKPGG